MDLLSAIMICPVIIFDSLKIPSSNEAITCVLILVLFRNQLIRLQNNSEAVLDRNFRLAVPPLKLNCFFTNIIELNSFYVNSLI